MVWMYVFHSIFKMIDIMPMWQSIHNFLVLCNAGLDVDTDHILQIACIITDGNLKTVVEGEEIVVHQPDAVLENMNAWCGTSHIYDALNRNPFTLIVVLGTIDCNIIEPYMVQ